EAKCHFGHTNGEVKHRLAKARIAFLDGTGARGDAQGRFPHSHNPPLRPSAGVQI
ncbi:hypothetical protein L9F63_003811, partial [Diploptera punctata]